MRCHSQAQQTRPGREPPDVSARFLYSSDFGMLCGHQEKRRATPGLAEAMASAKVNDVHRLQGGALPDEPQQQRGSEPRPRLAGNSGPLIRNSATAAALPLLLLLFPVVRASPSRRACACSAAKCQMPPRGDGRSIIVEQVLRGLVETSIFVPGRGGGRMVTNPLAADPRPRPRRHPATRNHDPTFFSTSRRPALAHDKCGASLGPRNSFLTKVLPSKKTHTHTPSCPINKTRGIPFLAHEKTDSRRSLFTRKLIRL